MARIDADDSRELRWYFSDPAIAGVGSSGGLGAMLERAAIMAIHLVPCQRCGGDREADTPGTGSCARGGGSYKKALDKFRKDEAKRMGLRLVADLETAKGWRDLGIKAASGDEIADALPDNLTKHCIKCEGTGVVQKRRNNHGGAMTVKSTGSSVHGNPDAMQWVDETALARYAAVSRKLDRVREKSNLARAALAVYYAPTGGSIGALWVLTEEGQKFFETADNDRGLTPEALMQNERAKHEADPTVERTLMFGRIARQTAEVWDKACAVWAEVAA